MDPHPPRCPTVLLSRNAVHLIAPFILKSMLHVRRARYQVLALWSQPQCSTRLPLEEVSAVPTQLSSECADAVCDVLIKCGPVVRQLLRAGTDTLRALVPRTVPSVLQCVAVELQVGYSTWYCCGG